MQTPISDFIHKRVIVVDSQTPCRFVAKAMRDRVIGSVVVANNREQLVGIITDRDLACNLVADNLSPDLPVSQMMTEDLVCVQEDASLEDVFYLMELNGIRRIPVISSNIKKSRNKGKVHKCIGIITLDDLLLAGVVPRQKLEDILAIQSENEEESHSSFRSQARKEQKYNMFKKRIAAGAEVEVRLAEKIYKELFSEVVQRLSLNGANQFISQLPGLLQEDLLSVPAGPNRSITAPALVENLMAATDLDENTLKIILPKIWNTLGLLTSPGELENTLAQLPKDIVFLLTGFNMSPFQPSPYKTKHAFK